MNKHILALSKLNIHF